METNENKAVAVNWIDCVKIGLWILHLSLAQVASNLNASELNETNIQTKNEIEWVPNETELHVTTCGLAVVTEITTNHILH